MPTQPSADDDVGRMQFLLTLRRRGISDAAVLRAMDSRFRANSFVETSYAGSRLCRPGAADLSAGQTISQPYVVAYMTRTAQCADRSIGYSKWAPARVIRLPYSRGLPAK